MEKEEPLTAEEEGGGSEESYGNASYSPLLKKNY
jgi:hypothetical protein